MLEAKLEQAAILKRLLDAIKELVSDANFQCNEEGIQLQAMDNSHVALVAVELLRDGFKSYRCDRPLPLGVNLGSLTKILKCAKDDDQCTLKAADESDVLNLTYEAKTGDRISDYELKLMDIDADTLGIPDTDYEACVTMPASEFARIVRDLSGLGESVKIEVSKDGVRFTSDGESANGNILLKQTESAKRRFADVGKRHKDKKEDSEDEKEDEEEDDDDEDEDKKKKKKKDGVKKEKKVKEEGGDVEMGDEEGEGEFQAKSEDEEDDEEEEEDTKTKKRKKAPAKASKPAKKAKKSSSDDADDGEGGVLIEMNQSVSLTFSLKYLVNFSKSSSLSKEVQLMMSADVPLLVSYDFEQGTIRYYLAPKIGDD